MSKIKHPKPADSIEWEREDETGHPRGRVEISYEDVSGTATRIWVDERLRFHTAEMRVAAHQFHEMSDGEWSAPTPMVIWGDALVPAVDGSTGALWITAGMNRDRALATARELWMSYAREPFELRRAYDFVAYAWDDHEQDLLASRDDDEADAA